MAFADESQMRDPSAANSGLPVPSRSASPESHPRASAAEVIQFVSYSPRKSGLVGATIGTSIQTMMGLVGLAVWALLVGLRFSSGVVKTVSGVAGGLMGAAIALWLWVFLPRMRGRRSKPPARTGDFEPAARLVVVCPDAERPQFEELPDTPFEPRVHWAGLAAPPVGWMEATNWVGAGLLFTAMWLIAPLRRVATDTPAVLTLWGMYGAFRIGMSMLFPAYYRVLPGRVELLRFHPLRKEPMSVSRLELRRRRVIVDALQYALFLEDPDAEPLPAGKTRPIVAHHPTDTNELLFAFLLDRQAFARDLVLAARSSAIAGPVSDNELVS